MLDPLISVRPPCHPLKWVTPLPGVTFMSQGIVAEIFHLIFCRRYEAFYPFFFPRNLMNTSLNLKRCTIFVNLFNFILIKIFCDQCLSDFDLMNDTEFLRLSSAHSMLSLFKVLAELCSFQ